MKRIFFVFLCLWAASFVAHAQCEEYAKEGDDFYSKGDYEKAAFDYRQLLRDCPEWSDSYRPKLDDCNRRLSEANNTRIKAEEDAAFQKCTTEEACRMYLRNYPRGRYFVQVNEKLSQFMKERLAAEEDEAFLDCTTEFACEYYLRVYPDGKYYSEVLAKKHELETERFRFQKEAEETAYMMIQSVKFANVDVKGNILNSFGSTLFASELRYLRPKIVYDGILGQSMLVDLYFKLIKPDGSVITSPTNSYRVLPGKGHSLQLPYWGDQKGGAFSSGNYRFELWFNGDRIWQTTLAIMDSGNALSRGNWRLALEMCNNNATKSFFDGSYKGQINDGALYGLGMYSWNDGALFIGNWRFGTKDGLGLFIAPPSSMVDNCPDCAYFVGEYSFDKKTGKGTCYDKSGKLLYYGSFEDDNPTQNYPTRGLNVYQFQCIEYPNGDYYVGETKSGKQHGTGMYISSDGDLWFGNWIGGKKNSYGIYMTFQGQISVGTWVDDVKQ